jgi:hypothetical protein
LTLPIATLLDFFLNSVSARFLRRILERERKRLVVSMLSDSQDKSKFSTVDFLVMGMVLNVKSIISEKEETQVFEDEITC